MTEFVSKNGTNDFDIIIVGGGLSGLYASYSLLKKFPQARIAILEKLHRVGGRIITEQSHGHILEYGPMRFEPELQKKFADLLKELSIPIKNFPPYTCPLSSPDLNHLSFKEIAAINKYNNLPPAFALLKYGLMKILEDQWDVEHDSIGMAGRDRQKELLKKNGTFQGRPLYRHGLWDTLAHVLSKEAIDFLQHKGTFYHCINVNPNAADQICFMLDVLAVVDYHLVSIEGGSQCLVDALLNAVSEQIHSGQVVLRMGSTVKSFSNCNEGDIFKQPSSLSSAVDGGNASGRGSDAQGSGLGGKMESSTLGVIVSVEEEVGESTDSLSLLSPSPLHSPHSSISLENSPSIANGSHGKSQGTTCQQQYSCQHVIFTCQQHSYASIQGFPKDIESLLRNSVLSVDLFKVSPSPSEYPQIYEPSRTSHTPPNPPLIHLFSCSPSYQIFVILDNPPFDEHTVPLPNYHANKVPCREIHYQYNAANKTGMIMIYGDQPSINYWTPFLTPSTVSSPNGLEGSLESALPLSNHNEHLKNHLIHYLRKIFPDAKNNISIVHYGMLDWSKSPYNASVHLWRPNYVSQDVFSRLSSFGQHRNLHVCGETFSSYQGFIEGCLRTVDTVVEQITITK